MSDLDDLLNGNETSEETTEVTETEVTETEVTEEVEAKGESETVESPATEQQETTPTESTNPNVSVEDLQRRVQGLTAGIAAERQKRHELEQQVNNSPEARSAQEEAFWQDPRGVVQDMVGRAMRENTVATTDSILSETVPEYQELRNYYLERAQQDPTLMQNAGNQPNPALYIYKTAKQMKEVEEIGSLDDWKATQMAKIEQDNEAKIQEGIKKGLEQQVTLGDSAGDLRAAQSNAAQPFRELSLDEIIGVNNG